MLRTEKSSDAALQHRSCPPAEAEMRSKSPKIRAILIIICDGMLYLNIEKFSQIAIIKWIRNSLAYMEIKFSTFYEDQFNYIVYPS
jgi:hypothetical protein